MNWDDDRCWKAGQFYFNRDDRRLLVPKRIGFGRTLNFAQPVSWSCSRSRSLSPLRPAHPRADQDPESPGPATGAARGRGFGLSG
nr:DUF5808 domain-containing protein [Streptacidiphilus melanogenes]